jgi:hypothetical protein
MNGARVAPEKWETLYPSAPFFQTQRVMTEVISGKFINSFDDGARSQGVHFVNQVRSAKHT